MITINFFLDGAGDILIKSRHDYRFRDYLSPGGFFMREETF